jgi:hypothetical protein
MSGAGQEGVDNSIIDKTTMSNDLKNETRQIGLGYRFFWEKG